MKAALITGVSSGIGLATTKLLLTKGYTVFGSVRNQIAADELSKTLGPEFHPLIFDVRDVAAVINAAQYVHAILGKEYLRVLVNNSGIALSGPLQHVAIHLIKEQFDVNVFGLLQVTQAFLPLLGAQEIQTDKPGKIINISSVGGRMARPFYGPYAASKHAVEALTASLRRELMHKGIDAIAIEPGPIQSDIWSKAKEDNEQYPGSIYHNIYKHKEKFIKYSEKLAIPAEKVAKLILDSIENPKPKTRKIIVAKKWFIQLMLNLPDRIVDRMMNNQLTSIIKGK